MPSIFAEAIALLKITLKAGLFTGLVFILQKYGKNIPLKP